MTAEEVYGLLLAKIKKGGASGGIADEVIKDMDDRLGKLESQVRCGSTAQWNSEPTYIPAEGQMIIYTDIVGEDGKTHSNIKIGDGSAYIVDLPFITDYPVSVVEKKIDDHTADTDAHVSKEDREEWSKKLNTSINEENLIFDFG